MVVRSRAGPIGLHAPSSIVVQHLKQRKEQAFKARNNKAIVG